jgi:D-threo-aldose 1-dehydrogenase
MTIMGRHAELVTLGRAGILTTRFGFGSSVFGGLFEPMSDAEATAVVVAALDAGIGFVDTAPYYGHGVAERRLGTGLAAAGALPQVLSTKVGRLLVPDAGADRGIFADAAPARPVFDFSAAGIRRSLQESLERLGVDRVDLALVHDPDDHMDQAIGEACPALVAMREEGIVRAIGVGTTATSVGTRFVRETDVDVVLIAGRFTLLDSSAGLELLPEAMSRHVSVVAAGVFNSGVLADPGPRATYDYEPAPAATVRRARAIAAVLAEFGVPLSAAALQFPLRHPAVSVVLSSARSVAELRANIADFDRTIPEQAWEALRHSGFLGSDDDR